VTEADNPKGRCRCSQDLSLDIDKGGDFLGILAFHVGQQFLEVEVDMSE
jgi:hypothetical protein